jgi:hypothetical protein
VHSVSEVLFNGATYRDLTAKSSLEASCSVGRCALVSRPSLRSALHCAIIESPRQPVRMLCSRMVAELEADFIERLAMLQRSRMSSLHVAAIAQARLAKLC